MIRNTRIAGKVLFGAIFALSLLSLGCLSPAKNHPVDFVERSAVFSLDEKANPLALVIEISEDGRLNLNKIETGTIADLAVLNGKLEIIFDDRKKAGIEETEVIIDPQGKVKSDDLEKLVINLADLKASPIRVITNSQ